MLPQGFHPGESGAALAGQTNRAAASATAVSPQGALCDDGLAPKMITTPEYQAVANYAYHLDAGKFAPFLHKHCTEKLGVRHVLADVRTVNQAENGDITSLTTRAGAATSRAICSSTAPAFASLLLGKRWASRFKDCSDVLFCDTALAMQVPYATPDDARWRRTPSPPRIRRAGPGTSACRPGAASAMSIPAVTSATKRRRRNCAAISGRRPRA